MFVGLWKSKVGHYIFKKRNLATITTLYENLSDMYQGQGPRYAP